MATDGNDDPLNKPLAELTLADLMHLGIVGTDNDKVPDNVPVVPQYAARLVKADLVALLGYLQAALAATAGAPAVASAARKKASAKKAPSKKTAAKKAASNKTPAKKSPASKSRRS